MHRVAVFRVWSLDRHHTWPNLSENCPFMSYQHFLNGFIFRNYHDISLLRGLVGSWLTPGGALGYKVMGRTHIYDSRRIINTINSNLMFN
jgi:hypothetical protein